MANHVHLLATPLVEPSKLMHSLKRFTAGKAIGCWDSLGNRSGRMRAMTGWFEIKRSLIELLITLK
jgi:REP element-mobilizing transposase RayT